MNEKSKNLKPEVYSKEVCVYSKFNLTKNNYNYKRGCRGKKK